MELFSNLALGLETALSMQNLFYCLVGVFVGTAVGVLPGLGPIATIAMLLPATFGLPPESALIMLAGIYYGAQYGGSTTAILVNLPGESSSVVTALDGYQMARNGQAGKALATAAISSFFAGTVATILLAVAAPPLADLALEFGPAEYFSLMVLGLVASVVLASGSLLKAIGMVLLGLLLGVVGTDVNSGSARYTFDMPELADGINFVIVAMGMFGIGEIIRNRAQRRPQSGDEESHRADAQQGRLQAHHVAGDPRHGSGFAAGHPAGRWRHAGLVRVVLAREESVEELGQLRQGRHRRRCGAGSGEQCGRADLVHPDADAGHSVESRDGADDRRDDHPGYPAWSCRHDRAAWPVLGPDRLDVGR
jgi:TctA family transporter